MEVSNQQLLSDLHSFLSGATRGGPKSCDLKLTQNALGLLKTLPAARDGILEYFCLVFESAVNKYASLSENDKLMNAPVAMSESDEEVINEINTVLTSFVSTRPQAWSPIISTWSLQLLGRLSSRYGHSLNRASMNETLHWWMSCKAARILIDITTQCLHSLIDTDAEVCVSSLLETSVVHSPYFDWVVALVGSCFSKTVITRVLTLGLKDFCEKGSSAGQTKSNKLKSIVGILGHLATGHFIDIRTSLLELFMWSLEPGGKDATHKHAVIPFLLLFSAQSSTLLNALSTDVLNKLDPTLLAAIADMAPHWKSFTEGTHLENVAVKLALGCNRGGAKIISLLLGGAGSNRTDVALTCRMLIELLLEEIERELGRDRPVPLLQSLKTEMPQILPLLLTDDKLNQATVCHFLTLIEKVNPSVTTEAGSYLLRLGFNSTHLSTLLLLAEPSQNSSVNLLHIALEQSLRLREGRLWKNLCKLLNNESHLENSEKPVASAVTQNMTAICAVFSAKDESESNLVMEVLDLLPGSCFSTLSLQLRLTLVTSCVSYFFSSIQNKDVGEADLRCHRSRSVLEHVCADSPSARAAALRELIEASLFLSPAVHFGSRRRPIQRLVDTTYSISQENFKLRTRRGLSGRQSTAFGNCVLSAHGGNIPDAPSAAQIESNILQLINIVKSCSLNKPVGNGEERIFSLDANIQTSLLLVSLISPDVMYNGLPWPEEDFCKVTIERDIHIRKVFDELPIAWRLVEMLALHQPALCYCSVLLRALMATLLSQWGSPSVSNRPAVLDTTVRLLRLMCLGQLLPPPLTALHDVIPLLAAHEVVSLLRGCVWNYMRDNVPTPALFTADSRSGFMWRDVSTRPPLVYTEPLRLILLQNIQHFGALYRDLFVRM